MIPDTPSTLKDLEAAKREIFELQRKLAAGADKVHEEFSKFYNDIVPDMLPETKIPGKEQAPLYGSLYNTLLTRSTMGSADPFDWQTLSQHTLAGGGPFAICKELLRYLWKKWYQADPDASEVVPRQLAHLALHCLGAVKINYESAEIMKEAEKRAQESLVAVRENAKRLRLG